MNTHYGERRWFRWGDEPPGKVTVWKWSKHPLYGYYVEQLKRFIDEDEARRLRAETAL